MEQEKVIIIGKIEASLYESTDKSLKVQGGDVISLPDNAHMVCIFMSQVALKVEGQITYCIKIIFVNGLLAFLQHLA